MVAKHRILDPNNTASQIQIRKNKNNVKNKYKHRRWLKMIRLIQTTHIIQG